MSLNEDVLKLPENLYGFQYDFNVFLIKHCQDVDKKLIEDARKLMDRFVARKELIVKNNWENII